MKKPMKGFFRALNDSLMHSTAERRRAEKDGRILNERNWNHYHKKAEEEEKKK